MDANMSYQASSQADKTNVNDPAMPTQEPQPRDSRPDLTLDDIENFDALQSTPFGAFSGQNSPFEFDGALDYIGDSVSSGWATPLASCSNCIAWGYQCQTGQEREAQGRCVPCASLGCECSFTEASPGPFAGGNEVSNTIHGSSLALADLQAPPTPEASKRSSGTFEPSAIAGAATPPPPKIGTRFSRDSSRILKQWLSSHSHHPYPSDEEKKLLQLQTGLSKTQITNWLINARRRGKVQVRQRSISPYSGGMGTNPINVPVRPGTPAPRSSRYESLNPLERWVDSPPEHEPATVTAIARAVASSHVESSDGSFNVSYTDDDRPRSLRSSASSVGTSSGGSFASAFSQKSNNSIGIPRPPPRGRMRQRKRAVRTPLGFPKNQYQCTFCTETFRTKHDWQRHEKSLHMPLEKWTCSPDGPTAVNPDTGQRCCVFCGEVEPSQAHLDDHNPSACQERTFNRKDHLKQHVRLVHNSGLVDWVAKLWRVAVPDIKSRCGFCNALLDTWSFRADHLADHFKMGQDISNWKGDWGFEKEVMDMVENSVPPYLIEYERFSPFPYQASGTPPESPRNAFGLLALELNHFLRLFYDRTGNMPNNREIQLEACRIVFASETSSSLKISLGGHHESWMRDLIVSSEDITREARFGPIRSSAESMMSVVQIKGKRTLFENCESEAQLQSFVGARRVLGMGAISDQDLQNEACKIVAGLGKDCGVFPSDFVANWLVHLIGSSTGWLFGFKTRAQLLPGKESAGFSFSLGNIDRSGGSAPLEAPSTALSQPGDSRPQYDNCMAFDDWKSLSRGQGPDINSFNQLTTDPRSLLQDAGDPSSQLSSNFVPAALPMGETYAMETALEPSSEMLPSPINVGPQGNVPPSPGLDNNGMALDFPPAWSGVKANYAFFNDANFHRWLTTELRRWVAATMSPNNPNCHVPSDQELQHQARFIVFEDGDPWNQTSADNSEWLRRFKRDVGIPTDPDPDPQEQLRASLDKSGGAGPSSS
ncbi:C2H2 type zinc finger domain-containing protein [Colletotrichum plurivorum]|uniref:C2H2 type zinc finger domain-containing protein n=1 Tax=Colletotrichum plurivorum TaxID=2175906 RepID=A0A8H6KLZ9_9PEZI|nr:C2H2 type zinc finger domain-containing protein [Colletotrichum plurivorum]